MSGLPAITVPAGFAVDAMPVGVELLGRAFGEPGLIALAYAFEQATHHHRPPDFTPSLLARPDPVALDVAITAAAPASGRATFVLDPATRVVRYSVNVAGLRDRDVLAIDLHASDETGTSGPMVLRLSGRGSGRAGGRLTLAGRELRLLQESRLYADVHTVERVEGAVRFDLALPE